MSNAKLTKSSNAKDWFTDAEMDTLGLSKRNQTFSISGLTLKPGDTITFAWFADNTSGSNVNMLIAIDNFTLQGTLVTPISTPVPEPCTMFLLASGLMGLAGFGKRRFTKSKFFGNR